MSLVLQRQQQIGLQIQPAKSSETEMSIVVVALRTYKSSINQTKPSRVVLLYSFSWTQWPTWGYSEMFEGDAYNTPSVP